MQTILGRIRQEKEDFRTKSIKLSGYLFSQYRTIQRIELYYNSKFESGEFDEEGYKKYFYNIVKTPCDVATKEIDLDTKDILVRPENGDHFTADFMGRELKQWVKEQGLAKNLNEYADALPKYGSIVVKKVKTKLHEVQLRNLSLSNPAALSLDHTDIIETHLYSRDELMGAAQAGKWDKEKVKEAIALYDKLGKPDITVDERYGWVRESELKKDGDMDKLVYTLAIVAGAEEVEKEADTEKLIESGVVLFHEPIKKHPYREHHFQKMPGRWMGVGFVELLFDAQMARNESKYYNRKGLVFTSLHLWQTDDDTFNKNMLTDVKNGDVLKVALNRSIQPMAMEERNLAHYTSEDRDWDGLARMLTFSTEILTGEALPSGTPARSAMITDGNVKRFFDRKREDFAIFIRELIFNDVMPEFHKAKSKAHMYIFSGSPSERDRIEQQILDARLSAAFYSYISANNAIPSAQEWAIFEETQRMALSQQGGLSLEIPEGMYTDFKYRIDVVITKENEDTDSMVQGRQVVLQTLAANPQVAVDPTTRPIFLELAALLGVKNLNIPSVSPLSMMGQLQPGAPTPSPATSQVTPTT